MAQELVFLAHFPVRGTALKGTGAPFGCPGAVSSGHERGLWSWRNLGFLGELWPLCHSFSKVSFINSGMKNNTASKEN